MSARSIAYLSAAGQTFLWLVLIYTLLALIYVLGLLPVPSEETRVIYFFRFWLSVPVALIMIVLVLPLVWLGKYIERKFVFPGIYPFIAIFPVSFVVHGIAILVPVLLIPIFLVGAFIYPSGSQDGNWGIIETTLSSINISVAFIIFWARLEKALSS